MFVAKRLLFTVSERKRKEGRHCAAYGCRKPPVAKKRGLCHCHYRRHRQIVDPVYDRYHDFKHNALKRHKDFRITLEEFRKFCIDNDYIIVKGNRGRRCTIDRIRNWEGYYIGNMQILTMAMNIEKYNQLDKLLTTPDEGEILFLDEDINTRY